MTYAEYDEQFISVDEAERLVIGTGQWRGTTVEFSNDGAEWHDWWLPSESNPHPRLARATVHREGVEVPTVVVAVWDEYYPDDAPDRAAQWDKLKTVMLSKVARVACYRQAYRDVIGKRHEPAEMDQAQGKRRRKRKAEKPRDWAAELGNAADKAEITALYSEALKAKAFVGDDDMQAAFTRRLETVGIESVKPTPDAPSTLPDETVAKLAELKQSLEAEAPKPKPGPRKR